MAKLITFSGTVGTGKTYSAKWARDVLIDAGYRAYYLRYRLLSARLFFKEKKAEKTHHRAFKVKRKKIGARPRYKEYRPRRLFPVHYLYYLLHALRLRVLLLLKYPKDVVIMDRYVYDSLTRYPLKRKRVMGRAVKIAKLFPKPDCSFILDAETKTLLERGKFHSEHYLDHVLENYRILAENLNHVCIINTEDFSTVNDQLSEILNKRFSLEFVKED